LKDFQNTYTYWTHGEEPVMSSNNPDVGNHDADDNDTSMIGLELMITNLEENAKD
jgi:hypothetical protein